MGAGTRYVWNWRVPILFFHNVVFVCLDVRGDRRQVPSDWVAARQERYSICIYHEGIYIAPVHIHTIRTHHSWANEPILHVAMHTHTHTRNLFFSIQVAETFENKAAGGGWAARCRQGDWLDFWEARQSLPLDHWVLRIGMFTSSSVSTTSIKRQLVIFTIFMFQGNLILTDHEYNILVVLRTSSITKFPCGQTLCECVMALLSFCCREI